MTIDSANRVGSKGDEARDRIKRAACDLFSQYGIDIVTTRDIARRAGQKNAGSVNYYFRSKEDLILEIIDDSASELNRIRGELLDELEASGRKIIIRDLLKIMLSSRDHENKQSMRLITMLQIYRRDLMHTQIPGRWDQNYERCLAHLKPLLPNYPEPILKQRLYFLVPYLWTFLATQEDGGSQAHFWKEFWSDPSSMESLLDTAEGILVQPPSPDTLRALRLKTPPDAATALMRPARPRDARRSKAEPRSPDHARS